MKRSRILSLILLAAAAGLFAYGGYWLGAHRSSANPEHGGQHGPAADSSPDSGRRILYWHDPMVPGKRFDKPGKSPFMDMQLVPVYAGDDGAAGVKISPTLRQNLGIRFATVRRAASAEALDLVGSTQFDTSREYVVQSRSAGYIDKLHVRAPLQQVRRGQALAAVFAPEWIAPQEEYLALRRSGDPALVAAARERMRALSMPSSLVDALVRTGRVQTHEILNSPVSGTISELAVREGAQLTPGMTVAKVVGMDKLWLLAEVPEALLGAVRAGMAVSAVPAGDAGRSYRGNVREVLPGVDAATRTAQARIEVDNHDASLVPGMLMRVRLHSGAVKSRLLVPTEAVIASGRRSIVLVAQGEGLQPQLVTTGRELGEDTEILSGLEEGQRVVASGQFLIDSEASLKSILPKFSEQAPAAEGAAVPVAKAPQAPSATHAGSGKVEQITDEALTLSHGPIPSLNWPAMTMDFNKPAPGAFRELKVGQTVDFEFVEGEDGYLLKKVTPREGRQ